MVQRGPHTLTIWTCFELRRIVRLNDDFATEALRIFPCPTIAVGCFFEIVFVEALVVLELG